jgi:predicted nucleotidyltransferase
MTNTKTNYNLVKPEEIKKALALRLEVLEEEKKALDFMSAALASYTKKQINKYFKDHAEALAPKYEQKSTRWDSITRQEVEEVNEYPLYTLYIEKSYFNKITLYISRPNNISGWDNKLYFTFYGNINPSTATEEEKEAARALTPENLTPIIAQQIENTAATIEKVKKDYNNAETLTDQYNQARQAYDNLLEAVHYYTRDQLTGKRDYNLSKNN